MTDSLPPQTRKRIYVATKNGSYMWRPYNGTLSDGAYGLEIPEGAEIIGVSEGRSEGETRFTVFFRIEEPNPDYAIAVADIRRRQENTRKELERRPV